MTAKQEVTKNDSAQVPVSDVFFFDVAVDVGRDLPGHAIARVSGCHGCDNAMAQGLGNFHVDRVPGQHGDRADYAKTGIDNRSQ